jgi:hypothetical protein
MELNLLFLKERFSIPFSDPGMGLNYPSGLISEAICPGTHTGIYIRMHETPHSGLVHSQERMRWTGQNV